MACTSITSIAVFGGGGFDGIRLRQIEPTTFTSLTAVSVDGGPEGDDIVGSPIADTIMGGDGNDAITIEAFDDVVDGGLGGDRVIVEVAGVVAISDDTLHLESIEHVRVNGSDQNDIIDATGYSGDLEIHGRKGDDSLEGGSRRNTLKGGAGNDVLEGGPEHDRVSQGSATTPWKRTPATISLGTTAAPTISGQDRETTRSFRSPAGDPHRGWSRKGQAAPRDANEYPPHRPQRPLRLGTSRALFD